MPDHPKDFPAPDPKHQLNTEGEVTLVLRLPDDEPALKFTVATKASVGDLAEYVGGILEVQLQIQLGGCVSLLKLWR